ncbi:S4 domain protein YaaA [Sinobaca qinghaiensis]|uniref:S4 domain protein YaaA n=1 Tax=Sinobaca qinghaiensis TaxID=342944 RepID=A0A419UTZ8_9BACL|nr:S4 domain-containing protein YaaA [Sinobaca qinghaiensis]RKD68082.1 S4 domain protein YaaA [Sinobaca qinghaiensis]
MTNTIEISKEYITLGQLLKEAGVIDTGGMAKIFLLEYKAFVNEEQDQRRGRKLYPGDVIEIEGAGVFEIASSTS